MSLLILMPGRNTEDLAEQIKKLDPDIPVQVWPDVPDPDKILFAVTWNHPPGSLKAFPRLKVVSSYGAGVDHMLADPDFPTSVTALRITDDRLTRDVAEYIVTAILDYRLDWGRYRVQAADGIWQPVPVRPIQNIGFLGLGEIGGLAARYLQEMGYSIFSWVRIPREVSCSTAFSGSEGLGLVAAKADVHVCTLPLTEETRGVLCASLFRGMKRGCYLINVGRGAHLVESDLIPALDAGFLSGACLDVFESEPIPGDHPFWKDPRITVTPHIAGRTKPEAAARLLVENYRRMMRGSYLLFEVDTRRGY